jgi:hypothetical protein
VLSPLPWCLHYEEFSLLCSQLTFWRISQARNQHEAGSKQSRQLAQISLDSGQQVTSLLVPVQTKMLTSRLLSLLPA